MNTEIFRVLVVQNWKRLQLVLFGMERLLVWELKKRRNKMKENDKLRNIREVLESKREKIERMLDNPDLSGGMNQYYAGKAHGLTVAIELIERYEKGE